MLGGLRYSKEILSQLLREEIMRESVTYQDLLAKGVKQGIQQGIQQGVKQGIQQGELDLALRLGFCNLIKNQIFGGAAKPRHQKIGSLFYSAALIAA